MKTNQSIWGRVANRGGIDASLVPSTHCALVCFQVARAAAFLTRLSILSLLKSFKSLSQGFGRTHAIAGLSIA